MIADHWATGLDVITATPPNAGTPLSAHDGTETHPRHVYVRSNFPVPDTSTSDWRIRFDLAERRELDLDDLLAFDRRSVPVALECAGNGRTLMQPVPAGTPWTLGGASYTSFRGVALADVLATMPIPPDTVELVFRGADHGNVPDDGTVHYEFSLSKDEALRGEALLAWEMGGQPLSAEHGAPIRLVVPGQYAMKSVKWLTGVRAVSEPFAGHFVRKYRYYGDTMLDAEAPVGPIQIRSLIATPPDGARLASGTVRVAGAAWSDGTPVVSVSVSADDATTWVDAVVGDALGPYAPVPWHAELDLDAGEHTIVARATDAAGRRQPLTPRWNGNGYGNNVVHRVSVVVG